MTSVAEAPTNRSLLGHLIRMARRDLRWSQTALGDEIGVAQSIISAWENGKARPNVAYLLKLADVLGVDRAALFDAVEVEETSSREEDPA